MQMIYTSTKPKKRVHSKIQRELQSEWNSMLTKWKPKIMIQSKYEVYRNESYDDRGNRSIPSRGDGIGNATLKESPKYSGNNVVGISIIHKSCLQPIFSKEEAIAAAEMRR